MYNIRIIALNNQIVNSFIIHSYINSVIWCFWGQFVTANQLNQWIQDLKSGFFNNDLAKFYIYQYFR